MEATPEDKTPKIEIALVPQVEGIIRLSFKDEGWGIPEDIREKIFMPNFTTKSSGSGIGLAVSKRGIEHAGGRIWFETETSRGTTFFIELPLIN
ncbi:MAG: hypothetical protein HC913_14125 [Microscillaceae bacterium]|nr:hypothetical protein [Microscillaceae bacterium]